MASVLQELRSCRDDAIAVVDIDTSHDISITLAMTQS